MANPGPAHRNLESLFARGTASVHTDRQLLDRFLDRGDKAAAESAFAALVDRHGPMVWGICLRALRDPADAGDAFQAAFLVLARRAGSVTVETSLAPWLHGVSVRVARRARVVALRQRSRERTNGELPESPCRSTEADEGLKPLIDEELGRLPGRYRIPLILCYLEGLTHEEAAARMSCPVGTVRSRLARGRDLLRSRLERRGLAPGASGLAMASASLPAAGLDSLSLSTALAAVRMAAGRASAEVVSARVATLVDGVSRIMTLKKLGLASATLCLPSLAIAAFAGPKTSAPRTPPTPPATTISTPAPTPAPKVVELALAPKAEGATESKTSEAFNSFPPFVVKTVPAAGSEEVDPTLKEIKLTFSKTMMDGSWSVVRHTEKTFPEIVGKIHYEKGQRTCILPVKLEPNTTYSLWLNTAKFGNFKDEDARSAVPYFLVFRTKGS
ncbi:RNA polymerase sigma factor [Singulisphaera sp. PoT]|uniref:RNA polymerase sigma factor n=1 Tax=Singulisphaera sp. PoT TaxID=3411797 RepID=UPI003BF555DB